MAFIRLKATQKCVVLTFYDICAIILTVARNYFLKTLCHSPIKQKNFVKLRFLEKEIKMSISLSSIGLGVSIPLAVIIIAFGGWVITRSVTMDAFRSIRIGMPLAVATVLGLAIWTGLAPAIYNDQAGPHSQVAWAESAGQATDVGYAYDPADPMVDCSAAAAPADCWRNKEALEWAQSEVEVRTEKNQTTISRQDAAQAAAGANEDCYASGSVQDCARALGPIYQAVKDLGATSVRVFEVEIDGIKYGIDISITVIGIIFILALAAIISRKTKAAAK
jgi:hypothetical protein